MDPTGGTDPCAARTDPNGYCNRCEHYAGTVPLDTSSLGDDYGEY